MALQSITSGDPLGNHRDSGLDGLRAIAITIVFIFHAHVYVVSSAWERHPFGNLLASNGLIGVDLFFVLSGFLITGILLKAKGTVNYFKVFYARRGLRIFPLYYLALAGILIGLPLLHVQPLVPWRDQWWYWLNVSSWLTSFRGGIEELTHFWTLANEEQFYLIWPLLVRFFDRRKLAWICASVILGEYIGRALVYELTGNSVVPAFYRRMFPLNVDGLLMGALLAILLERRRPSANTLFWVRISTFVLGMIDLIALSPYGQARFYLGVLNFQLTAAVTTGVICLIVCLPEGMCSRFLSMSPLRTLGRYSYCFYSVHLPLMLLLQQHVLAKMRIRSSAALLATLVVLFLASVLISVVSWAYIEEPILKLKRHYMYLNPS